MLALEQGPVLGSGLHRLLGYVVTRPTRGHDLVVLPLQDHDVLFAGEGVPVVGDGKLASVAGVPVYLRLTVNEPGDVSRLSWLGPIDASDLVRG